MSKKNHILDREHKKPILWDAFFNQDGHLKPIVIFCHGYKGFKDWGAWDLVAEVFKKAGYFFIKFNFSHNGGTIENPIDFPDLEAFAENNYTKELDDLKAIIDLISSEEFIYKNEINKSNISLIGHSRGGGISTIKASEDTRITTLITWASVSGFGKRTSTTGDLEQWKKDGVKYVLNGRTKQKMPHNYQFYLDYKANEKRLDIEAAAHKLSIPFLVIHGTADPSVAFSEAEALHASNNNSILLPVDHSNHVFNAIHPWEKEELPNALKEVVMSSIKFIEKTH